MRVFVAGVSGALGSHLVPQLIAAGHEVIGTHHSPDRALVCWPRPGRRTGQARPAGPACRAPGRAGGQARRDRAPGHGAGQRHIRPQPGQDLRPHQPLAHRGNRRAAGRRGGAGVRRFVAQSFAPYLYARQGGPVKTEADPVDATPPPNTGRTYAAITYLEQAATGFGGIALRYGGFYGAANDALIEPVRQRQLPVVGDGGGIFPWLHLDDGAAATVLALEHAGPAIYNIVDDEPAPVRDWLPVLASALGARPPRHAPARPGWSPGRPPWCGPPRPAAPPTPRPSASSAGRPGTPAGAWAFPRCTRRSRSPPPRPPRPPSWRDGCLSPQNG